jgi:N-acetyltransferase
MIEPVTLENTFVRLEPLSEAHISPLLEIAQRAPEAYTLTSVPPTLEGMTAYVNTAMGARASGRALPFATVDQRSGRVVGSTRLGNLEFWAWMPGHPNAKTDGTPDAAEIGWTWLAPEAQRTPVNTAAKLLMLEFAFETWCVRRVTLKTDARNERSRNAIERIGASFEGILRSHLPAADGGVRDSAMFSLLQTEWSGAKARLEAMLRPRAV